MNASLDTKPLRTFHAILRFGRFLAVTSHLDRNPSAVSTHVRRLEELTGDRLFERDNRSMQLIPLEQRFQRRTAKLLETHGHVFVGLRRREEPLRVHFSISEEHADRLLGRLLPRLDTGLPALELEMPTDANGRLAGRLRRDRLDLALLVQIQDEIPYDGHSREIGGTQPVWIAGHGLRIDPQRPLPLALHGQGCPYRQALLKALDATGRRWHTVVSNPGVVVLEAAIEGGLAIDVIDRARVGPTIRVLGPAEGFTELPAHRTRLAFAPGEQPPALERLDGLIAGGFRP